MADHNTLQHHFTSAKTANPDSTLLDGPKWNKEHIFAGGVNGQFLSFQDAQTDNVLWVDLPSSFIDAKLSTYGLAFDGVTDDSAALQTLINTLSSTGGRIVLPPLPCALGSSISLHPGVSLLAPQRGISSSGGTLAGHRFKWIGAINTPVIRVFNCHHCCIDGVVIDCNSVAGSTGILYDSDGSVAGMMNAFKNFSVYNAAVGFQWGTSAVSDFQVDGTLLHMFHIRSSLAASKGIVVNSGNAAQYSRIDIGVIQLCNIGIDLQEHGGLLRIESIAGGSLSGANPICIQVGNVNDDLAIINSQSESGAAGIRFIKFVGSNAIGSTTLLQGNKFDEPVDVTRAVRIVSIGNYGAADVIVSGTGSKITSIGDRFGTSNVGWGITDTTKQVLTIGGVYSGGAESLFPLTLDAGASGGSVLSVLDSGTNPNILMTNYGAGGCVWGLLFPRTGGINPGGFVIRDSTNSRNAISIDTNPINDGIHIYTDGVRVGASGGKLSFGAMSPITVQTVTGSRGGNVALADILTKLANMGLIIDGTS